MNSRESVKIKCLESEIRVYQGEYEEEFARIARLGKSSSAELRILKYKLEVKQKQLKKLEQTLMRHGNHISSSEAELARREMNLKDSDDRIDEMVAEIGSYAGSVIDLERITRLNIAIGRERTRNGRLRQVLNDWRERVSKKSYPISKTSTGTLSKEDSALAEMLTDKFLSNHDAGSNKQSDLNMDVSWMFEPQSNEDEGA